jgi:hypothetical protein
MSAGEDNLEIDVYGEGAGQVAQQRDGEAEGDEYYEDEEHTFTVDEPEPEPAPVMRIDSGSTDVAQSDEVKPMQGTKRKSPSDERHIDSSATTALMVSDLHWWMTEDDLRAWANSVDAECDLMEVTFSEHKVNGKSKGQVYLLFRSAQSATAVKHKIESMTDGSNQARKFGVTLSNASSNPFKTMPKDAPVRNKDDRSSRGAYSGSAYSDRGSFRGRGRGYDRGGFNRNFSGPSGGSNYNNNAYGNSMGMMNNFGFNNRGGMMNNGMRGGNMAMRGGRGANMNNIMPMGGPMGMPNMAMGPMMAGMGMQGMMQLLQSIACPGVRLTFRYLQAFKETSLAPACSVRVDLAQLTGVNLARRDSDKSKRKSQAGTFHLGSGRFC